VWNLFATIAHQVINRVREVFCELAVEEDGVGDIGVALLLRSCLNADATFPFLATGEP
jgi:hypothetical protein